MLKVSCILSLCLATPLLAYNNGYEQGDSWTLSESFLLNKEGGGRFLQGDPNPEYNADEPIWFYLEAPPGDDAGSAVPLGFSGYHPIGMGWGHQLAEPTNQEPPHIDSYPYIVRAFGADEGKIYVHPAPTSDLLVAWTAPAAGRFKAEATFQRGGQAGDGVRISWVSGDKVMAEADVEPKEGATELVTPEVTLKKGERLYFRLNAKSSANDDSGLIYLQVTYEGP